MDGARRTFLQLQAPVGGLRTGIDGVDVIMIFQGDQGMHRMERAKFNVGADASAAAGPVGRNVSARTDWNLKAQILTYAQAKGAFGGLTLSGVDVRRDDDSMRVFYGRNVSATSVLTGKVAAPAGARKFLEAIKEANAQRWLLDMALE